MRAGATSEPSAGRVDPRRAAGPRRAAAHSATTSPACRMRPSSTRRVLLAHRLGPDETAWPAPEDRFASDLLLPDRDRRSVASRADRLGRRRADPDPARRAHARRARRPPHHGRRMELTPGLRRVPPPDLASVGQDDDLAARIRDEIQRDGPMTFARFMDLALYDPDGGYYRSEEARPGRAGDFLTAPETHPIFGRTLARFVDDVWQALGPAGPVRGPRARRRRRRARDRDPDRAADVAIRAGRGHPLPTGRGGPSSGRRLRVPRVRCRLRLVDPGRERRPVHRARPGQRGRGRPARSTASSSVARSCWRSGSASMATASSMSRPPRRRPTCSSGSPPRASRWPTASAARSASPSTPGSRRPRRTSAAASRCSSTTAIPPPSCTTRSDAATAPCAPTSATRSTTIRTRTSGART